MEHAELQKRLSAYCSDDLGEADKAELEAHLTSCPECRSGLAELQTTLRLIRSTPEVEPPPWLTSRIMAHVREEQSEKRSWLQRLFFPLHVKLPLEIMALVTVCIGGYYLARTLETELPFSARHQELPASSSVSQKPAVGGSPRTPAASPPGQAPSPPATAKSLEKTAPAPSADSSDFAPAPPVSPAHKTGHSAEVGTSAASALPANRARETAPGAKPEAPQSEARSSGGAQPPGILGGGVREDKGISGITASDQATKSKKSARRDTSENRTASPSPAAPKSLEADQAGLAAAPLRIRLDVKDEAISSETVRQIIRQVNGTLISGEQTVSRQVKARIPAVRLPELLERLGRLGRIVEQPSAPDTTGIMKIDIVW